jgi:hypothetical protein
MVFLGIYRAIYDYAPQSDNEIGLKEGDMLMVLEKSSDDDWWKAKKKGLMEDEDEPEGLIPNNYIEEVSCEQLVWPACPSQAPDDHMHQHGDQRLTAYIGRAHLASQSSLRLRPPDQRRALVQGRRRSRRLRHHRPRLDAGRRGHQLRLCSGELH